MNPARIISCEISIEVNFYDRLVVVFVHHLFDLFNVFCPMSMPKSMNIFLSTAIIFQICLNDFFDKKYRFDLIFCSTTSVHFPTEEKNYRRDSNLYLSSLNLRLIFNCFQRRNITREYSLTTWLGFLALTNYVTLVSRA